MSAATHIYWYKILDAPPPSPLPTTLPLSDLDTRDNFIHLSTAVQIPITLNRFFASANTVWLLKLRSKDIDGEIRFEEALPECPHVHDTVTGLGKGNVEEVIEAKRAEGQEWKGVKEIQELKND
ncbi:unnamed protein product [Zymoseptoria tritici ST99CH_3D7]|uniref:DUF952 domain-containing protein n=1 Tax=Zymoseptoria tritici (strain ST99CH_3D7) TaxID=1276538 RepID=A0A1X7RM06_ZYMT9|nr:unnamed protein product [Zymoseptoria tritici ST99CH_3D7]